MKTNGMHYRYTDDGVVVSKPNKWKLEFPRAKAVRRSGDNIIVYNAYNQSVRVDKYGNRHYHW